MLNADNTNVTIEDSGINMFNNDISVGFTNPKIQPSNFLRMITLIPGFSLLLSVISAVLDFAIMGESHNYSIISFEFNELYTPFQTYHMCFFLCLFLVSLLLIFFCVSLIRTKDETFVRIFNEDLSYLMPFSLVFMVGPFIIGIVYNKNFYSMGVIFILTACAFVSTAIMYRRLKHRKNIQASVTTLITGSFFFSMYLSLQCYILLFNLCDLITRTETSLNQVTEMTANCAVAVNGIYLCIALGLLTTYRDILFSMNILIIETGYLTNAFLLSARETLTAIGILLFLLISIVVIIIKYRKAAFGFEEDGNYGTQNCLDMSFTSNERDAEDILK